MKKLLKYETPSARLIEIHTESFICGSANGDSNSSISGDSDLIIGGGDDDLSD